jgi:hypothetical protein
VAVSHLPQRVLAVYFAHWAFSNLGRNIYIYMFTYMYLLCNGKKVAPIHTIKTYGVVELQRSPWLSWSVVEVSDKFHTPAVWSVVLIEGEKFGEPQNWP